MTCTVAKITETEKLKIVLLGGLKFDIKMENEVRRQTFKVWTGETLSEHIRVHIRYCYSDTNLLKS